MNATFRVGRPPTAYTGATSNNHSPADSSTRRTSQSWPSHHFLLHPLGTYIINVMCIILNFLQKKIHLINNELFSASKGCTV